MVQRIFILISFIQVSWKSAYCFFKIIFFKIVKLLHSLLIRRYWQFVVLFLNFSFSSLLYLFHLSLSLCKSYLNINVLICSYVFQNYFSFAGSPWLNYSYNFRNKTQDVAYIQWQAVRGVGWVECYKKCLSKLSKFSVTTDDFLAF